MSHFLFLKRGFYAPLFLVFFLSANIAESQCCDYSLIMYDSYGDGWNGASLEIVINDVSMGIYSGLNSQNSVTFPVCNGDAVELFYTPGEYENENSYQVFDPVWNLFYGDGPNPAIGNVFSGIGDCDAVAAPGSSSCNGIPLSVGSCLNVDNSGLTGTGFNPGCAAYEGGDIWFAMEVPASGNISLVTSNGGLTDTGIAAWTGTSCISINSIGCDDDSGVDYYSMLMLYDLTPGETLYIEVFGYGGGSGPFQLCANDLGTVDFVSSELPIFLINTQDQTIVTDTKIDATMDIIYNGPGNLTYVTDIPNVYSGDIGIEIRGATSAGYPQRPYNIETRFPDGSNNNISLLEMPAENDWVLLSNFNDLSLIRNPLAFKLFEEMGNYSVRTSLCEVIVNDSYKGVYVFGEKIKPDSNRVSIAKLTDLDNAGDEVTGGYILQQNYWDTNNSFQSNYSPIDHPGFDVHFVYEYPKADVITVDQKTYIASYVDSLETALYSADFMDPVLGYRKFMGVNSFIDYFLVNELARSNDGFKKSVFFHKDKNSNGGKLKAGPVWDFDWAFKDLYSCSIFENGDGSGWAHLINDCPTDNYSTGWYVRLLQDSTFANELRCTYEEYRLTMLDTAYIFGYIDSVRTLVQNAQARHFQKWPILGLSGPAPEVEPIATTYNEELDALKDWIALRLAWLDENIPGHCPAVVDNVSESRKQNALTYFPNPGSGIFHFNGKLAGSSPLQMCVYDVAGKKIDSLQLTPGNVQFEYQLNQSGVYYFTISNQKGIVNSGKLIVI